jgi:hypothetical protein
MNLALMAALVAKRELDPLIPGDFVGLARRLSGELWRAAGPIEEATLARALRSLVGADWTVEGGEGKRLDDMARTLLAASPDVSAAVTGTLDKGADAVVDGTRRAVGRRLREKLGDLRPDDERLISHLAESQGHFVTNARGERVRFATERARGVIANGVEQGLGDREIARRLKATMGDLMLGRSEVYYENLASVFTARARAYTTMASFDELGVTRYKRVSVLAKNTCSTCRFLHGRVGNVSRALQRMREVEMLDDPEGVRTLLPWPRVARLRGQAYDVGGGQSSMLRRPPGTPAEGAEAIFYVDGSGQRRLMARIDDRGGVGTTGRYSNKMPQGEMENAGLMSCPSHSRCQCRAIPA